MCFPHLICVVAIPSGLFISSYLNYIRNLYVILDNKMKIQHFVICPIHKECMSDSVTNYNNVGDTKISVSIKKTNANKCTLSEIFLTEILKSFSAF